MMSVQNLISVLKKYNQEHLLHFWDEISEKEKGQLQTDISELNIRELTTNFHKAVNMNIKGRIIDNKLEPISCNAFESINSLSSENLLCYEKLGLQEIANGKVAVVLLAGGQGTRLGVNYPKGIYNVGLPSQNTLFHLQALRIQSIQNQANKLSGQSNIIPWYIMTSDATYNETIVYFQNHNYFGLSEKQVIIFKQGTLPCFTFEGKIILEKKSKISKAPDGNGGLYIALKKEEIIKDMKLRGVNSVHIFSVDNILVKVADPIFIGYCLSRNADCGVKVVTKRSADEPVGIICQVDGKYSVVEYSEISDSTAKRQDSKGNLLFNAGNICNHYFTVNFLEKVSEIYQESAELHIAKKKIPYVNSNGVFIEPDVPNGIKIEKFVFDVFKYASNFVAWEVRREEEFSALKNSDIVKIDCPFTARTDLLNLHKKWLLAAGAQEVMGDIEICPLLSYNGENLTHLVKNKKLQGPLYFQ